MPKKKFNIKEFTEVMLIASAYLIVSLLSAIFFVYLFNIVQPLDLTSDNSIFIALAILSVYFVVDFGLLYLKKLTFTTIVLAILISPALILYKLFSNYDLLSVGKETPDTLSSYVFMKKMFC